MAERSRRLGDCTTLAVLRGPSLLIAMILVACTRSAPPRAAPPAGVDSEPAVAALEVEDLLRSDSELARWLADAERLRLQVLVAFPDGAGGLRQAGFRVDREYFYPASAVKLCAAVGALGKLEDLGATPLTEVKFVVGQGRGRRALTTTMRREIEKALIVSDNEAFNRLLDFVGPEELAERLARRGLSKAHIAHRLGETSSSPSPTIELIHADGSSEPVGQRIGFSIPPAPSISLGRAYRTERGRLIRAPMNFANKNAIPLSELQDTLLGVMRPELTSNPADWEMGYRDDLVEILGMRPSDLDRGSNLDTQYKPLDVAIATAFPELGVRIHGKGGRAYGFAVENAYVASEKTGRWFFVTAAIYANGNDVMNDDRYEYEAVANPFMTRLGIVLSQHLLVPTSPAVERNDEH